jgi:peptide/nickel transport system substrate-binding protein
MLTTRFLRGKRLAAITAAGLLAAGVAACSSSSSSSGASHSSGSSSSATVVMESSPETTITRDFNPFDQKAPIQGMGADGLIFEPLVMFNLANPSAAPTPWLATASTWNAAGTEVTFTARSGVKWSDGTPFTAADIAFTFNYVKANPAINLGGDKIASATSSGDTATVTFTSSQIANLQNIEGQAIIEQKQWSSITDPGTAVVANPVGTGPYTVGSFTSQGFTMTANPSYWQSVPVKKVFFPAYTTNTAAQNALYDGTITWTGNFIQGVQQNFVAKDPATHHLDNFANSTVVLIPNMQKWPTSNLAVREAIRDAVDRTQISTQGEDGQELPQLNADALTSPLYTPWGTAGPTTTVSATADVAKAEADLTAGGFKKDSAGFYALNGKEADLTIEDPTPYSDYAQDDTIIASQLKAAGINATVNDESTAAAWQTDLASGNFDLTVHWGNGGITPYNMYDNWLDDTLIAGANTSGDFGRFQNSTVQADLAKLAMDSTTTAQATDLAPILNIVATQLPVIPLVGGAAWSQYNSSEFTGWPSASNPYQSGQPSGSNNGPGSGTDEDVLLHLTPVS